MKTVELVSGIHSSVLGFGCAPILGSVEPLKAQRALDCAMEMGVNHFDLARSYGYGDAEQFVGKVIKGRRDQLVLASKFGIKANWKAGLLKPTKPLVRLMRQVLRKKDSINTSALIESTATIADHFHDRVPLRSLAMKKSLENSLRALKTDYLDYFFLHEPREHIEYINELVSTIEQLKVEGKIRAWGLAYMRSQESIHHFYLNKFDALQFDNSPGAVGYEGVVMNRGLKSNIIFSPLQGGDPQIKPSEKLQKLHGDFPRSVILCSMFNEKHLRENVALFD